MSGKLPVSFSDPSLEPVDLDFLSERDIRLSVLRLDQIHPVIHGNKWFKLRRNIDAIKASGKSRVLSFGGAWSNHLQALAGAGKAFDFDTIGVIRGELPGKSNPVLNFLVHQGMQLHSVSRADYRKKTDPSFLAHLRERFGDFYLLPEGGSNGLAVSGCREIADYLGWQTQDGKHLVAAACGTGATLAGLILGLETRQLTSVRVLGVSVLKARGYLGKEVAHWLAHFSSLNSVMWGVADDYHCGGYGRSNAELDQFLRCFASVCPVPLEPVYTGKLAFGLYREIQRGAIEPGTEIIAIHTGGIINQTIISQ